MPFTLRIIEFISLALLLLVTGVFWGTWFSLSRSIEKFTADNFLAIGKVIIRNLAVPMRILMPLTILFMAAGLWLYPEKVNAGFYLEIISFALIVITLHITVLIEVPIDNRIKRWTTTTLPVDWKSLRSKWEFFHTIRTFTSIGSFLLLLLAVLFY
ncbi:MAG TPA: DUF1772 domain-containing protein [Chitinophagaceae bacterium]|nr:DUF1772 domain-containing protein [Chitinophagaceae bacterium]